MEGRSLGGALGLTGARSQEEGDSDLSEELPTTCQGVSGNLSHRKVKVYELR